ncbi:YrzE family protein [Nonomuraea maritima]|uniref:YrzE family protein n=1 Tax=Nonomuraea maritima TaxID=683260 RepID=UPI0037206134
MVYLITFAGLILAGLALFAPLPPWIWAVLALAITGIAIMGRGFIGRRKDLPSPDPVYVPPPPVSTRKHQVLAVALPSMEEDYDFLFSATVRWSPLQRGMVEPEANLPGLAVDAILERATSITSKRAPGRSSLVQHELDGALGTMQPDATERVEAMAESVTLTLADHDRQRLDRLAEIRKEKAVWEHERKYEQSRREYLGGDVLKDPGSAVVWWLTKNDDQVERVVQDLGILAQVSSAANNQEVPEPFRHLVSQSSAPTAAGSETTGSHDAYRSSVVELFAAFLDGAEFAEDDPQRALFSRQVAEFLARFGKQSLADELTHRFDSSHGFGPRNAATPPADEGDVPPVDDLA